MTDGRSRCTAPSSVGPLVPSFAARGLDGRRRRNARVVVPAHEDAELAGLAIRDDWPQLLAGIASWRAWDLPLTASFDPWGPSAASTRAWRRRHCHVEPASRS